MGATGEQVHTANRWLTTLGRWTLGMVLVSWRYMWSTTPLHRSTDVGDATDLPPVLPDSLVDEHSQPLADGVGPLFHRLFSIDIEGASVTAAQLISRVATDLNQVVPSEVTVIEKISGRSGDLGLGDEFVVRMPGPWDGPVRVVRRTDTSFRFATLSGHLEAGQIEFRAGPQGDLLRFEIEAWARPSSWLTNVLFTRLWLAREIQLNMWVRFCRSVATLSGGRARGGVTIRTRVVDQPLWAVRGGSTSAARGSGTGDEVSGEAT